MPRRKRHEEHEHHEAWAIPYGDLVTLLLAFFVVMYSMSEVNDGKYRVLSNSLTEAFGGTPHATQAGNLAAAALQPIEVILPSEQVRRMIALGLPDRRLLAAPAGKTPAMSAPQPATAPSASLPPLATLAASPSPSPSPPTAASQAEQRELERVSD